MRQWRLYGAGLEALGDNGHPGEVPVPEIGSYELLVRVDACGLCFSDTKVVKQGENHPRLTGRNLVANPVVLGHEVACTVVRAGSAVAREYPVGSRHIIQADVFHQGRSMAFGYVFDGGLTEYQRIPREMLEGDEGSYLLPVRQSTGVIEAALVEPWACVVATYNIEYRSGILPGGRMLILHGSGEPVIADLFEDGVPEFVVGFGLSTGVEDQLPDTEYIEHEGSVDWDSLRGHYTDGGGFDDIILLGDVPAEVVEAALQVLSKNGVGCIARTNAVERPISLDIGRIHYDGWYVVGTDERQVSRAYRPRRGAELTPGGRTWIVGAGGPMGQMHTQRAIQHPQPPGLVVASDIDRSRLEVCRERFEEMASGRGIQFEALNPAEVLAFESAMARLAPDGFDDVVCMTPVPEVIESGYARIGDGGVLNVFAGAGRGTQITVDVNAIVSRGARIYGASGSNLADIRLARDLMESGELQTRYSLAAIGGMNVAREGIAAVMEGRFPGKIVILPHAPDLPLIALPDLKGNFQDVAAKLERGRFWTLEAERELLPLVEHSGELLH